MVLVPGFPLGRCYPQGREQLVPRCLMVVSVLISVGFSTALPEGKLIFSTRVRQAFKC